jgi:hypothetical protein
MFIVDLQCREGHTFEGWYESTQDYYDRLTNQEVSCPICDCSQIERRPSAIAISQHQSGTPSRNFQKLQQLTQTKQAQHVKVLSDTISLETQKAIARILQKVRQTHIDVGNQFTNRAISMSRSQEPFEPIIGESSPEEENRLDEEGIPYFKIPIPDIENN